MNLMLHFTLHCILHCTLHCTWIYHIPLHKTPIYIIAVRDDDIDDDQDYGAKQKKLNKLHNYRYKYKHALSLYFKCIFISYVHIKAGDISV